MWPCAARRSSCAASLGPASRVAVGGCAGRARARHDGAVDRRGAVGGSSAVRGSSPAAQAGAGACGGLSPVQRAALDAAFGLTDEAAPEQFRIAMAALDLVSDVAGDAP